MIHIYTQPERASESLREHRQFLLANKWVRHNPLDDGEACLVARGPVIHPTGKFTWNMGDLSRKYVQYALDELHPDRGTCYHFPWVWNDEGAQSFNEVIEVLERAEKLALRDEELVQSTNNCH